MKLILAFLLLIIFSSHNFAQSDADKMAYLQSKDNFKTGETFSYYMSNYETDEQDSLIKHNSSILKIVNPDNYVRHELARVLFYRSQQNLDSALTTLSNLQSHSSLNKSPIINASFETLFGIICYDLKRPIESRKHYLVALSENRITNDSSAIKGNLINIGNSYFIESQLDSAEFYFKRAKEFEDLGINDFSINLANNFATVYQNTDRYDLAIEKYLEILTLDDQNNRTHYYNLGLVYFKNNEIKKSIEAFENAIQIQKNNSGTGLSEIYMAFGVSLNEFGKSKDAYNALRKGDSLRLNEDKESTNRLLDLLNLEFQEEIFNKEQELTQQKIENKKTENFQLTIILIVSLLLIVVLFFLFMLKATKNKLLLKKNLELTKPKEKASQHILNKSVSPELIIKLERLLYEKEVYIDPNLTLEKLAKLLNSNRTYVSENINLHFKISFSGLIKSLRIKKAREMLIDEEFENYSIEGIATSVGYKSISSFNTSFKKETGITPSYFRNNA